jgi:hypothetical protein
MRYSAIAALSLLVTPALAQNYPSPTLRAPTFSDPTTTRQNLGLGSAATLNTGTSGGVIPLLNGANTWSAAQTFGTVTIGGTLTLSADPVTTLQAATKQYVDSKSQSANFTGGVVANATTFQGTGTGLSVTNDATVGGALSVGGIVTSGASSQNQIALKPQAAGTSPQVVAQGTDANMDLILAAKGTGVIRTGIGAILRGTKLSSRSDLTGGTAWGGGVSSEGKSNLFVAGGVAGTAGAGDASVNYFAIASDTMDCRAAAGGFCSGLTLAHNFGGASAQGSRNGYNVILNLTATTGNNGVNGGGSYVGGQFTVQASANDNGTTGTGNGRGLLYGINPVAALNGSGATFYRQLSAMEANVYAVTGTSVEDKIGIQLVQASNDKVQGTHDDVAISINNQNGAVGWQYGLEFGRAGGAFPITTTGTMIGAQDIAGAAWSVANGIDWHLGTATSFWMRMGSSFSVDGSGNVTGASYKVGATAGVTCSGTPTASFASTNGIVTHC